LAQVVCGQGHETVNFGGQEVKSQNYKAKDRYGDLAETSFFILLGRVAFIVVDTVT